MKKFNAYMPKYPQGFTLIEVLVALFIFGWLSLSAYQLLDQVMITQIINTNKSKNLSISQKVYHQLSKDLRQMANRSVLIREGVLSAPIVLSSEENIIEFTRRGWSNPLAWPRSELQRVAYRLDYHPDRDNPESIFFNDERIFLIRCFWTILDRTENSEPILQPLLGGVLAVEFQFWSHVSSSWLPDPPFMGIPKAIEMNILYENDELQSHIFKIL